MVSLGTMIYLVARKVPKIVDTVEETHTAGSGTLFSRFDRFISSLPLEKVDFFVSQILEKFLRKTRVVFMKLDNQMARHLEKFKNKVAAGGEGQKKIMLFEKEAETKEENREEIKKEENNG